MRSLSVLLCYDFIVFKIGVFEGVRQKTIEVNGHVLIDLTWSLAQFLNVRITVYSFDFKISGSVFGLAVTKHH